MPTAAKEKQAAILSVITGIVLLGLKFVAYWKTGSAAILSDALESIVNVLAAFFALYAISLAHQPADAKHPYGHGKIEFVSAGFEGGMILLAALVIAGRVVQDLVRGPHVDASPVGIWLMATAMFVNGGVGFYLIGTGRRHGSITLEADGHHLLTDAVTSVGVLIALSVIRMTGWAILDPIAAGLVAVYIAVVGIGLIRRSLAGLMDTQDLADEAKLVAILDSHIGPQGKAPRICSYHKLRHRHSGRYHWIDFHIVVPAKLSIAQGHEIASAIEYEMEQTVGQGNATAHIEPCVDQQCGQCGSGLGSRVSGLDGGFSRDPSPETRDPK
jgi:cation diffusion facilitator family transporter